MKILSLVGSVTLLAAVSFGADDAYDFAQINNAPTISTNTILTSPQLYGYVDRVEFFMDDTTTNPAGFTTTGTVALLTLTNTLRLTPFTLYSNDNFTVSSEVMPRFTVQTFAGAPTNSGSGERYLLSGQQLKLIFGSLNGTNKNLRTRVVLQK
jgi:hypothetical protein